jgi:hypothetical protein
VAGQEQTAEPQISDTQREQALNEMAATMAPWGGRPAIHRLLFIADLTHAEPQERPSSAWAAAGSAETGIPLVDPRPCCGSARETSSSPSIPATSSPSATCKRVAPPRPRRRPSCGPAPRDARWIVGMREAWQATLARR